MGKLTTKNVMAEWLQTIDQSRVNLIEAAKNGNRVAAAFATADARVELIESLQDEMIRAKLLRITDPRIAMVELANNPTDDDRIRVCAIAILSGFEPGRDQFAVFGGGKNAGKLYIKEAGFRTLFAHLGITVDVNTTHPEYTQLGSGRKIWRVGGSASCEYRGELFTVEFDGENQIGIPGYDSDNVAGIAAKARRRILQALWVKVSPILTDDVDDEEIHTVSETSVVAVESQKVIGVSQAEVSFRNEREIVLKLTSVDPEWSAGVMDAWDAINDADSLDLLKAIWEGVNERNLFKGNQRVKERLTRWKDFRKESLA